MFQIIVIEGEALGKKQMDRQHKLRLGESVNTSNLPGSNNSNLARRS